MIHVQLIYLFKEDCEKQDFMRVIVISSMPKPQRDIKLKKSILFKESLSKNWEVEMCYGDVLHYYGNV